MAPVTASNTELGELEDESTYLLVTLVGRRGFFFYTDIAPPAVS